jgi:hypothetical protein
VVASSLLFVPFVHLLWPINLLGRDLYRHMGRTKDTKGTGSLKAGTKDREDGLRLHAACSALMAAFGFAATIFSKARQKVQGFFATTLPFSHT